MAVRLTSRAVTRNPLGTITIFGDTRLVTALSFLYRREREEEPAIRALREVVAAVFQVDEEGAS